MNREQQRQPARKAAKAAKRDTIAEIKAQYARVLAQSDWKHFKDVAEYYLRVAAKLKKRDISSSKNLLLLRNSQKRLFLGIACELLLKSFYLKKGRCINKFTEQFTGPKVPTHRLVDLPKHHIKSEDSFTMDMLINHLHTLQEFQHFNTMKRGFQIAMAFRNKEGHVTFPRHEFNPENYRDISQAVSVFYSEAFGQTLQYQVSMRTEKAIFQLKDGIQ